ncbi:hypothetical protein GWK53_18620 [Burkholderia cepacia]|uniref:hypothetical protein n=1 Tax=Burkholderia cepacia TaxID=292 RepID=UPI0013F4B54E|nr:hypothetical protein [Burkholderia cepacia]NHB08520.1 hypothetical protein [Burkholderia cepacia]
MSKRLLAYRQLQAFPCAGPWAELAGTLFPAGLVQPGLEIGFGLQQLEPTLFVIVGDMAAAYARCTKNLSRLTISLDVNEKALTL